MLGDRLQQSRCDLVWIGVKKPHPTQVLNRRKLFQQQRQAVFQPQIFSITGRILPNQGDLTNTRSCQTFRLGDDRLKAPGPELAAQMRNDAEAARMISTFSALDVGSRAWSSQHARC